MMAADINKSKIEDANRNKKTELRRKAEFRLAPEISALRALKALESSDAIEEQADLQMLLEVLQEQLSESRKVSRRRSEMILMGQAIVLQSLFARLLERSSNQDGYISSIETFMKLALRAQSQCRATLETLALIQNPPIVVAKQANIAAGHQQVINGSPIEPVARENLVLSNELSKDQDHVLRTNSRNEIAAGRANSGMAAMVEINRPKVPRRKSKVVA